MKAVDIIKSYHNIEYLSTTDGKWYPLRDYYPFAFITDDPDTVLLDTGGEMKQCEFWLFKIEGDRLLRKDIATGEWINLTSIRLQREEQI